MLRWARRVLTRRHGGKCDLVLHHHCAACLHGSCIFRTVQQQVVVAEGGTAMCGKTQQGAHLQFWLEAGGGDVQRVMLIVPH
jgi:hypothetical protein